MDFKEATDALFTSAEHAELAEILGISIASIRQARLAPHAKAHRAPPSGWESAVIALAERQLGRHQRLIEELQEAKHEQ